MDFLNNALVQMFIWSTVAVLVFAGGLYLIVKVRSSLRDETSGSSEMINNFRELHDRGELSDEEYRTIKTMLATRLQQELKGSSKSG